MTLHNIIRERVDVWIRNICKQSSHSVGHGLCCVTSRMSREHLLLMFLPLLLGLYCRPFQHQAGSDLAWAAPLSHTLLELVPRISGSGQFHDTLSGTITQRQRWVSYFQKVTSVDLVH
jgi:hypothetical protein